MIDVEFLDILDKKIYFCYNQSMRRLLIFLLLLLAGCSSSPIVPTITVSTVVPPAFATATLVPTLTPRPSLTLAPPTIAPTVSPVTGVLTTQLNVRTKPDKTATVLGTMMFGTCIQIVGKDPSSAWYQIIYPENSASVGWVSASYVQVNEVDIKKVMVQSGSVVSLQSETQQSPVIDTTPTTAPRVAQVSKQIFVRSGPGQTFSTIGTVNPGTTVILLGRNQNNVWIQIQFDGGVSGKGWIASAYLVGANTSGLPFYDNNGNLVADGMVNINPSQVTATATAYSPAITDGDSREKPGVTLIFSPEGARDYSYTSELSAPYGDSEDWVAIRPYEPTNQSTYLYFELDCVGNGGITAVLETQGAPVPEIKPILCGNYGVAIKVLGGSDYLLDLKADGTGGPLRYIQYTLKVNSKP